MKIAFAGKGGVGKTTLCAWLGDHLARLGHDVMLVDADTALSLGQACGIASKDLPVPLSEREDLIRKHIGSGFLSLNPDVAGLPHELSVELPVVGPVQGKKAGRKRLLVMGSIAGAGDGCACAANALLKSLLAYLMTEKDNIWMLVDMEAGVEHLGRGTVADVDGLIVVSEPSRRSLETAAGVGRLAEELGLGRQVLALNRCLGQPALPDLAGLPECRIVIPPLALLTDKQLHEACVLDPEISEAVSGYCESILAGVRTA